MAYYGAGRYLLLSGGYGASGLFADTWKGEWSPLGGDINSALYDAAVAYYPVSSKIVVFGGKPYYVQDCCNVTETWDGQWHLLSLLLTPDSRSGARMAYNQRTGRLVLFGGLYKDNSHDLNDTW